jgi:uncharacterized membrane protein
MLPASALVAVLALVASPIHAAPTVYNLGVLPTGTDSQSGGVTPDGWIVCGGSNTSTSFSRTFRWTLAGGLVDLGPPPLGSSWTSAGRISSSGNAAAGNGANRLFRWSSSGGMQNLGIWPSSTLGLASGISGDGAIVVGWSNNNGFGGQAALRWAGAGLQLLPSLPGGLTVGSNALGISPDGSIIVGTSGWTGSGIRTVRWLSAGTVVQDLGTLPGGNNARGNDVSTDNSTIVGSSNWTGSGQRAFRWTSAGGMVNLGVPGGGTDSSADAVNGDGKAVVGAYQIALNNSRALLWNTSVGTVDLTNYITSLGGALGGYTLIRATDINQDGSAIVATGSLVGVQRAFLIRNIPCPSVPIIIRDPVGRAACPASPTVTTFAVDAEAPGGGQVNLEYRWVVEASPTTGDLIPLSDGPFVDPLSGMTMLVSGAATPTLHITDIVAGIGLPPRDIKFGGTVTNPCGTVITSLATLRLSAAACSGACSPADIADTDGLTTLDGGGPDGAIDNGDFTAFFSAFFATSNDPARAAADIADTDGLTIDQGAGPDGQIDNGDFTAFFAAFFAGCPA